MSLSRVLSREPPQVPHAPAGLQQPIEFEFAKIQIREPIDPRDHSLLELVYSEMHAARFINLQPLAVMKSVVSMYFDGALVLSAALDYDEYTDLPFAI